jgi:hypothetical protein
VDYIYFVDDIFNYPLSFAEALCREIVRRNVDSGALVMNGTLLLSGKNQISDWLKTDVQTTRATPADWQANGNMVITTGSVSLDRLKKLGIDSVQYRAQYIIDNGKITSDAGSSRPCRP